MSLFHHPRAWVSLFPDNSKFKIKGESKEEEENRSAEFNNI